MQLFLRCVRCHKEGSYGVGETVPLAIEDGPTLQVQGYTMGPACMENHLEVLASVYKRLNGVAFTVVEGEDGWRVEVLNGDLCKQLLGWKHPIRAFVEELFGVLGIVVVGAAS